MRALKAGKSAIDWFAVGLSGRRIGRIYSNVCSLLALQPAESLHGAGLVCIGKNRSDIWAPRIEM